LPEGATWKDVVYEAYTRQEIEDGLNEARRGEFVSDNKLISTFAKWGVNIATQVD
jgi:predicted transcriptional regulator